MLYPQLFHTSERNVRLPHGGSTPSFGYSFTRTIAITTDAAGSYALHWQVGQIEGAFRLGSTITAQAITALAATSDYPSYSTIAPIVDSMRINSAVCHFVPTTSFSTNNGVVNWCPYINTNYAGTFDVPMNFSDTTPYSKLVNVHKDVCWATGPTDEARAAAYQPLVFTTNATSSAWYNIMFFLVGAPASTTIGYITFTCHAELLPEESTITSHLCQPPAPHNPKAVSQHYKEASKLLQHGAVQTDIDSFSNNMKQSIITAENSVKAAVRPAKAVAAKFFDDAVADVVTSMMARVPAKKNKKQKAKKAANKPRTIGAKVSARRK